NDVSSLSPRIVSYLNGQLELPPTLGIQVPDREATYLEHRKSILNYLGFRKFESASERDLQVWLEQEAQKGELPEALFSRAERYLLARKIMLPGSSVLERLIVSVCSKAHEQVFEIGRAHV